MAGRCTPPPRAKGCNRNRPDINTTTVGGLGGGAWGLCIPVVISAGQKGGGFGKWTSVTPRGRKPIFHHPKDKPKEKGKDKGQRKDKDKDKAQITRASQSSHSQSQQSEQPQQMVEVRAMADKVVQPCNDSLTQ